MSEQGSESGIIRRDGSRFSAEMEALSRESEAMRLSYMKSARSRSFMAMSVGILAILIGGGGFGWFLLVEANIIKALACVALGVAISASLHMWSGQAIRAYKSAYKREFMPKMASLLGGFQYHPSRGISSKIISKTGIVPSHDIYAAEDCFMGKYKGVKVLMSEARLLRKAKSAPPVFNGLFVLLEIPQPLIKGHIILTADKDKVKNWRGTRWQKLQDVAVEMSDPSWDRFSVFSDKPQDAQNIVSEALLKELAEAADIFDESPITAALFRQKYIFLMIPYDGDMFEASNIDIPVATKQHALKCKREIEQLLEVIDVFDLYDKDGSGLEA